MGRLKVFLIILVIIAALVIVGFIASRKLSQGEEQKFTQSGGETTYYWTIATSRRSLTGNLPDQLKIYSLDDKLVFDSDTAKPMFDGSPKISIKTDKTKDGAAFKQTFDYAFADVTLNIQLFNNQKYADITTEIKYSQDKASQFEGIELALDGPGKSSYIDEAYSKQGLTKKVQISQWSPHVIEAGDKYKATLIDNTAEVMELQKTLKNTNIKFYSYYGPTREGVFARNYDGANKAEPKIDTNIKRAKDETVNLSSRLFIAQDSLSYLPFRWPYAKDSVVVLGSHADLGTIKDVENEGVDRINSVFYGSSRTDGADYGKKGILSHKLRTTFTVFAVQDAEENSNNGSTLEAPKFYEAIKELYRRGVDIGAHRLAYEGIGVYKQDKEKIVEAFDILSEFNPTVWIDHRIRDCVTDPRQENIAACGSIKGDKLNVVEQMAAGTWKYWWASGQDSQGGGKDYQLSAFEDFLDASRILYYYQGASEALIPPKLLAFAQSYTYEKKEFTTGDLDKLAEQKGYHHVHAYFVTNSPELDNSSLKKDGDGNTYWRTSTHLENGLKGLEDYQEEDKVWVRDFTTIADFLQAWQDIKIIDFTNNSITIKNEGENAIDGLSLYNPAGKIESAKSGDTYYPYVRDGYVVLPRLEKNETRIVEFGSDDNIPQIKNLTDKHIEISDVSYNSKDKKLSINIAPSGKPGQDLIVDNTDIVIELPSAASLKVTRDGVPFTGFSLKDKTLTITTDTKEHEFLIQPLLTED